jgi:hypothetical protein
MVFMARLLTSVSSERVVLVGLKLVPLEELVDLACGRALFRLLRVGT